MRKLATIVLFALAPLAWAEPPVAEGQTGANAPLDPSSQSPGLKVGEKAPDIGLTTSDGEKADLGAMYAEGPIVVTFYRGRWCPYCNSAMTGWEAVMPDLKAAGATFVAISPEKVEYAKDMKEKVLPSAMVLSDESGDVARAFRVAFTLPSDLQTTYKGYGVDLEKRNASGRWELPAPATFVIDREGVVRYAFADWDYKKRADPEEVLEAVRAASSGQ